MPNPSLIGDGEDLAARQLFVRLLKIMYPPTIFVAKCNIMFYIVDPNISGGQSI